MSVAVVVFTRDLRVRDNPALHAAATSADQVVPLFVVDPALARPGLSSPNRAAFLADCLADLDQSLRKRESRLVIRHGEPAATIAQLVSEVGAEAVHLADDYSRYATAREERLRDELGAVELHLHSSHVAVAPGVVRTTGGETFSMFTPYYRRWAEQTPRSPLTAPDRLVLPEGLDHGRLPAASELCAGSPSPNLPRGGEDAGRRLAGSWYDGAVGDYEDGHDALADDATSRLSPYLHFGCVSAGELVARADRRSEGAQAFLRQLAWRDFFHQVLDARPDAVDTDIRTQGDRWSTDKGALAAWKEGRTGYPLVDAGMRQLLDEGWMHNRARLVVGSFLTKHLYIDWRVGARHFAELLVDADAANNSLNWQWVAGTGTDSRPNRMLNPVLQQQRYDADFAYVRRHVPEYGTAAYPQPIVDHAEAVSRFREARGK